MDGAVCCVFISNLNPTTGNIINGINKKPMVVQAHLFVLFEIPCKTFIYVIIKYMYEINNNIQAMPIMILFIENILIIIHIIAKIYAIKGNTIYFINDFPPACANDQYCNTGIKDSHACFSPSFLLIKYNPIHIPKMKSTMIR